MPTTPFSLKNNFSFTSIVNSFSIWVFLGSFCTSQFFAKSFDSQFTWQSSLVLALSVWIIYTLDHILDGKKLKSQSKTLRHYVHFRYQKWFFYAILCVALFAGSLVIQHLTKHVIKAGMVIAILTAFYLATNQWLMNKKPSYTKIFIKEIIIAFVVMLGFAWLPITNGQFIWSSSPTFYMPLGVFFFINLINLLTFSRFDFRADSLSRFLSITRIIGVRKTRLTITALLVFTTVAVILSVLLNWIAIAMFLVFILMLSTLWIINLMPQFFSLYERYRFWGDFVFVIPMLFLSIEW